MRRGFYFQRLFRPCRPVVVILFVVSDKLTYIWFDCDMWRKKLCQRCIIFYTILYNFKSFTVKVYNKKIVYKTNRVMKIPNFNLYT